MKTAAVLLGEPRLTRRPQRLDCAIAEALRHSLKELGFKAEVVGSISGKKRKHDLLVVLWSTAGLNLKNYPHETVVHVTSEQLPFYKNAPESVKTRWKESCKEQFKEYDCILEHSFLQTDWLKKQGYNVVHFPWGYTPTLDMIRQVKATTKYDLCFLGTLTARRKKVLKVVRKFNLRAEHVHENRGAAIREAAINLSINNADGGRGAFPSGRVVCLLLGNGAFVISEPPEPGERLPLVDDQHLVYATPENIEDKIRYYLEHKEERTKIAQQGYEFVTQHFTMTQNLKRALEEAKIL